MTDDRRWFFEAVQKVKLQIDFEDTIGDVARFLTGEYELDATPWQGINCTLLDGNIRSGYPHGYILGVWVSGVIVHLYGTILYMHGKRVSQLDRAINAFTKA